MHGIVTLLPSPYYERVETLWKELETEHNLKAIQVTPFPHFSWQIAAGYDFDVLEAVLQEIASTTAPIPVRTAGLGLFSGPRPVIFIPVVKSTPLIEFHARLWERTAGLAKDASPLYHPDHWIPHITLAFQDVDRDNVSGVIRKLAFEPVTWEMAVENLALIYEPDGEIGQIRYQFEFQKNGLHSPGEAKGNPG